MDKSYDIIYKWLKEIESIAREVRVCVRIADVSFKAIEIDVKFLDAEGKIRECKEIILIENEIKSIRQLFDALQRIKLYVKFYSPYILGTSIL